MMRSCYVMLLYCAVLRVSAQTFEEKLDQLQDRQVKVERQLTQLEDEIAAVKLEMIISKLDAIGWPSDDEVIKHAAFGLAYSEQHEQAKWVAHVIPVDVLEGRTSRTNDFRPDLLIATGSTVEEDYFLKSLQPDSTYEYDGFGYDRGHLAPSADFRWNAQALSESYFYSNMSPQRPEFNRESWAELESLIRGYIYRTGSELYVVTGPILQDNLPRVERSVNGVSIPEEFFKVVLDKELQRGIAFIMPNAKNEYPLEAYSTSIDEVEERTGFDFFPNLEDNLERAVESNSDYQPWLSEEELGDVVPLYQPGLKKNQFNTIVGARYANSGEVLEVCGTAVSVFKSGKGHIFINLDKKFPNQIFTVNIWADDMVNFSYDPEKELPNRVICAKGKVMRRDGVATMDVNHEKKLAIADLGYDVAFRD